MKLPGYQVIAEIYSGSRTLVCRAIQESNQKPVAIKILRDEYPTFQELLQFRNQYTIAKNLNCPGVIKTYSLQPYQNSYALVMEDFGGISLQEFTKGKKFDSLNEFFPIALQIVSTLDELYKNRVIHKDIKPANILINPVTKEIKLIDFSIASLLPKETQAPKSLNVLEGTLAYISPEQTGRMNRLVDWRSDFYSLGVTLFELLTGELPFPSNDPMELVYNHLAKQPPSISSLNPKVPESLSHIIAKLMAKNAEERYQSALGLKYDLENVWQEYQKVGDGINTATIWKIGQQDRCDRFAIPEKLYGRESEVESLLSAFERIANPSNENNKGVEIMLVAGFSGIGKTAVVNEVHKPIVRQRGYFIKGKYDQFQRNIPFFAFLEAFRDLIEQLLCETTMELQTWKTKILAALGGQGKVITDVIPELTKIIGEQPIVAELSGSAATNRFNLLFQKFIQVFTNKEHPLVIFIDDLQWADSASLNLMQTLVCEKETQHLLLIGAYRDNEVSTVHPLMMTLDAISQENIKINTITLQPLSENNLTQLVADTLDCSSEIAQPLTKLIYQRTQGNPFFSNQFFKSLYDEKLIYFNFGEGCWQCHFSKIQELPLANNVVDFVANQLQKLPHITQNILKLAACIGNQFDLNTLAIVNNKSLEETATDLWKALQDGLIIPTNEIYKFFQDNHSPLSQQEAKKSDKHNSLATYKFLHDRVQQAAYSLIPESEKKTTHFNIGQLLLRNTPESEIEDNIFNIVNQLNYGVELINNQDELNHLARLNLIAGRKAKISTAYTAAISYLDLGLQIIPSSSWQNYYSFCLELHEEACESAYLSGNFERMEELAEIVINSATCLLDKIKVYEIKVQADIVQNKLLKALRLAIDVLKLLNVEFPESPSAEDIQKAFKTTAERLSGREIADLINLPEMTDVDTLAAMRILSSMFTAAYLGCPDFVPLVSLKMVDLSIEYGNTGISANGYCTYAFLLCAVVGDIQAGHEFGKLSLNLLSKTNSTLLKARVLLPYNSFIGLWKNHAYSFLKPLQDVYNISKEIGDFEFSAYSLNNFSYISYLTGKELIELESTMAIYCEVLSNSQQQSALFSMQIWRQTVLNLINKSEDVCNLVGDSYNEEIMLPIHQKSNYVMAIAIVNFNKLTLNYLFGNLPLALDCSQEAEKYLSSVAGSLIIPTFYFYDSLVRLAAYCNVTPSEKNQYLAKINANQEKMRHWANHAPMNFLHKYYLVEAEKHRIFDDKISAMDYYDKSIYLAKENEYIQEEALANELAAKFYLTWGKKTIAQTYLTNAYYCYARWGALAKVEHLKKHYPDLLSVTKQKETSSLNAKETISVSSSDGKTITGSSTQIIEALDFFSLIKASHAISGEMELDKLLVNLMEVLIENAAASKAVLILPDSDKLVIEAIALSNKKVTNVLQSIPIEESQDIPINLINYVSRKKEHIIFNNTKLKVDNTKSHNYHINDPYITINQPRSLLCNPILKQGRLVGILYLENSLTSGAFTKDRLQVINLLCSQAAISLENARLYQESQDNAQQLQISLEELKQAQLQLVQSEKMSTLGNLVSGIGHEINNPINYLSGNLQPANEYVQDLLTLLELYEKHYPNPVTEIAKEIRARDLDYIKEDLPKVISSMRQAIDRIYDISISLRTFSRADTQKKIPFNIHDGIDSTLMILQHRLKASQSRPSIQIVKKYSSLPEVKCFPGQLNQVFMNLLANAIDALDESNSGRTFKEIELNPNCITIITTVNEDKKLLTIKIQDNGPGMSEEVKAKIFDHLFTTKPVGKGTGLGLAIANQIIVEKHGGFLDVDSAPGEGAAFIISIPIE
ncbi:ATP-binding sensor histidine kinase [Calothrix sp. 336/3]|uniref:ATP-binding sensor histidine kinase n=1 Tax=Calothrix sp. 336/3 TaxID=1337936 RepID=UPI0004E39757|nr:ATP-binding sensor histidine kinase [Calothrix sp. 336/3]AKG22903.1 serine/threonine protein kinase [Calothrix sp. 336/3]